MSPNTYCSIKFTAENTNFPQQQYEKVFSFSLFMPRETLQLYRNAMNDSKSDANVLQDSRYKKIRAWFLKYAAGQAEIFKSICDKWKDFSILHFVSEQVAGLTSVYQNPKDGLFYFNHSQDLLQAFSDFSISQSYPYRQYTFDCPSFQAVDEWFGSVVRFFALQFQHLKIVLFRDAHTTAPNPRTNYDRDWYETWLKTNKRFFMYTAPYYNPQHASGEHTPFAAIWGARNSNFSKGGCFSPSEWSNTFGKMSQYDSNLFEQKPGYGVDERLFDYTIKNFRDSKNETFEKNCYFVGITWLGYLFYNRPHVNTSEFQRHQNDPAKSPILYNNEQVFLFNPSHMSTVRSYYSELKCLLLDGLQDCASHLKKNRKDVSIDEFFDFVEMHQQTNPTGIASRLPNRYHIWEYLFETPGFNPTDSLIDYVEKFARSFLRRQDKIENQCDSVNLLFTGDAFDPFTKLFNNQPVNHIERVPKNYPLTISGVSKN